MDSRTRQPDRETNQEQKNLGRLLLLAPPGKDLYIRDNYCSYTSKTNCYWSPLDLLVQSGILRGRFNVDVLDCPALRYDQRRALEAASAKEHDVILSLTGMVSWQEDEEFFRRLLGQSPGQRPALFVMGDVALTAGHDLMRRWEFLDGCLLDYTSRSLSDHLSGAEGPSGDLLLRDEEDGTSHSPSCFANGTSTSFGYPVPDHRAFPLARYRHPLVGSRRFATVISSQGCNMGCSFCVDSLIPLRLREIENLFEELVYLRTLGVRELYFYDPNFTSSRGRIAEVCDLLEPMGFSWFCNAHVGMLDEDTIPRMKNAGCHTVMVGFESGSDRMLRKYKRGRVTRSASIDAARLLREAGIATLGYFMLGLPGETEDDVLDTIDFSIALGVDYASFNVYSPIAGTPLATDADSASLETDYLRQQVDRTTGSGPHEEWSGPFDCDRLRRLAYRRFYLRPSCILRRVACMRRPSELLRMTGDFARLVLVNMRSRNGETN